MVFPFFIPSKSCFLAPGTAWWPPVLPRRPSSRQQRRWCCFGTCRKSSWSSCRRCFQRKLWSLAMQGMEDFLMLMVIYVDVDLLMIDLVMLTDLSWFIFWVVGIFKMWLLMKLCGCLLCCWWILLGVWSVFVRSWNDLCGFDAFWIYRCVKLI